MIQEKEKLFDRDVIGYTKFYCEKCKKHFYVKGEWIMAACPICHPEFIEKKARKGRSEK